MPHLFDFSEHEADGDSEEIDLPYPFHDRYGDPYSQPVPSSPLNMGDPSNIKTNVEYDTEHNQYNINENVGDLFYRNPSYLTFDEFVEQEYKKSTKNYWRQRASEEDKLNKKVFSQKIQVRSVVFDRIFGGSTIDIRPQGSAELTFGVRVNKTGNPAVPEAQRTVTSFDFDESIQMNVIANIGDKLKLSTNYNTESTFDFENQMKIEYSGYEDDIIKKIDAGNVTLPLNSQLIQGSQSLFGFKTQLQFGRLMATLLYSQQKGKSQTIEVKGGAQTTPFEIRADQYESNKHFFLAQYFKDHYDAALTDLNQIRSGVNITKIEVWVTNRANSVAENRNIVAFTDLGEFNYDSSQHLINNAFFPEPDDGSNDLYAVLSQAEKDSMRVLSNASTVLSKYNGAPWLFTSQKNYEIRELAKKLTPSEYTLNAQLGYISLNQALDPGQVLAVAYEYTLNGRVYHVGDLSTTSGITGSNALFVKLIKSTQVNPKFYTWDLMMKNIYSLGAYQIEPTDFRLDVLYQSDRLGSNINYIPLGCDTVKGVPLIKLFNLDDLNTNRDPQPDGVFDYLDGITINSQSGKVIFPVREPFGSYLESKFCGDKVIADQFTYNALYDSTKTAAQQQPERNKFILMGSYKSASGSDIPLNAVQVAPGSVKVTAGGQPLVENVDFTVDYTLGRVKIINEGILKSNTPIQVTHETNQTFDIQTKRMIGGRFDYYVNKDITFGATIMNLTERPLTQKINIGDEPISNTVIGADGTYKSDSRILTKILDKLPLYSTKEISNVTIGGEIATIIPGHSSAIGKSGTSYIDDFEGAVTPLDINNPGFWQLASTPQGQLEPGLFPEGATGTGLAYGFNRALIAWYRVDPLFQRPQSETPSHITATDMSNNYVREVPEKEIFPLKQTPQGPQVLYPMNVAFYPSERGPNNYTVDQDAYSDGLNADGTLASPAKRWGGIMRRIETTDFEASNVEYIEFWMMDPFADNSPNDGTGGELYFNLGGISEDVLRDDHKVFENGLPSPSNSFIADTSIWGRYPNPNVYDIGSFDNDEASRQFQDIGMDGLKSRNSNDERNFFDVPYLQKISALYGPTSQAYIKGSSDPSADDYYYFQSNNYNAGSTPPLERYKKYNGTEGNSPAPPEIDGYYASSLTTTGDKEDANRDNNMDTYEAYYQYHVDLKPNKMVQGQNYITDVVDAPVNYEDGHSGVVRWYQFKIPVQAPEKVIGGIDNFKNIQFIRMYMKNFSLPIICRFAKLELIRGDWRKYNFSLLSGSEFSPPPEVPGITQFDVTAVNYEENSARSPVPYVLPPGIEQEAAYGPTTTYLNEQSLSLKVCDLEDGDARAVYKTTQLDMRSYKRLKMFAHVEATGANDDLNNGDLTMFVRLGNDFNQNYYEYEIPLTITHWGATNPYDIWPEANNLDLELQKFIDAKLQRNAAISAGSNVTLLTPFVTFDGSNKITIRGTPNLSNVRAIMIGIRNPKSPNGTGARICAEIWVNELRLSDFDEAGGWASTAHMSAKLADLGTMTLVGNHSVAGWGSIEKRVSERDKEDKSSYDFSTAVELGKFLPPTSGVSVPVFFSYGEQIINPQYNPLDPDVKFSQALDDAPNPTVRDSIKKAVQDYTQRKSINFTNVRKTKTGKGSKPKIYDVENLNFSYAYNEIYQRNVTTEYSVGKNHQGSVGYNFNTQPKSQTPFNNIKALNSSWLKLVKDFNFNLVPSNLTFLATINRGYQETQLRNNTGLAYVLPATFVKTYTLGRMYGLQWDLTKSLKFDFNASALANVDEPAGRIDTEQEKDSVRNNFWSFGRLTSYHHTANITYAVPLNKIPLTDWISGNIRYGADYTWNTGALAYYQATNRYDVNSYGNTIQNSQNIQYSANFNLVSLYNKNTYLRKINQDIPKPKPMPKPKLPKDSLATQKDSIPKPSILEPVIKGILKLVMSAKTASFSYTETNGIIVPGFRPRPDYLGMDWNWQGGPPAPGWGFISGSQDTAKLKRDIINNHWLTDDTTLNSQFGINFQQNFSARATLEPVKSLKIDLTATRNYSLNHLEYFRSDPDGNYNAYSPTESGNFSISYLTWNTSFVDDGIGFSNANFDNFSRNRREVSNQLANANRNSAGVDTAGYRDGYGATQQEVLTYSFLSAYTGKAPSGNIIDRFPKVPKPNWRVTYDGLAKMPWARKIFSQFSLAHGYRSNYSINSFTQNLLYTESEADVPASRDAVNNFIPRYDIALISISEQFSPLISIDATLKNSFQCRLEVRRDRTLTLTYSNIQVTEVRGVEYILGLGYRWKNLKLPFKVNGKKTRLKNDLNLKGDFGIRDNTTIIRKLVEQTNQASAGNKSVMIKISVDYNINERFNVRAFFDRNVNNPFVSASYPTAETSAGIKLRFTLAQ